MENSDFWSWVKAHKKQLMIVGISIATTVSIVIGIKNKDTLIPLWNTLEEKVKKTQHSTVTPLSAVPTALPETAEMHTPSKTNIDVVGHVRTMALNKHHSPQKELEAADLGISLLPNQTFVSPYTKYAA